MANLASATISSNHAIYGLEAYVDIDGKKAPIISATIEFALNQIPVANVTIPSGVKFDRAGGQSKEGLLTEQDLQGKKPAKIIVTGAGRPHPAGVNATPSGDATMVLFEGYLVAKNVQFGTNSISTTLTLFHWMYDLDTSSFASGDFVKTSPQDWFDPEPPSGAIDKGTLPLLAENKQPITVRQFKDSDWWQNIMDPVSRAKANQDKWYKFRNSQNLTPNTDLLKALNRMTSNGALTLNAEAKAGIEQSMILANIHQVFARVLMYSYGGSSGFEKLVSLGREFKFMLAPRVTTCLVVPYNPVQKVEYTLTEKEFDFGFSSSNPTVVPRGVIVFGDPNTISAIQPDQTKKDAFFIGQYVPKQSNQSVSGPFFTLKAPDWMHSLVKSGNVLFSGTGPKIGICPDTDPGNGKAPGNTANPVSPPTAFADAFAKACYFDNLFSAKIQEVVCGFRTDIGPGDCILLKGGSSGENVSGSGPNWEKRGMVDSVSYLLSGGDVPKINTIYRLRHVFDKSDIQAFDIVGGVPHPLFGPKPLIPLV